MRRADRSTANVHRAREITQETLGTSQGRVINSSTNESTMNFTLTKTRMVDESDWGLEQAELAALYEAEDEQTPVKVLCRAVDADEPADAYYDIELANGARFSAVQGYHILGIEDWKAPSLTAQYVVELKFGEYNGSSIDHAAIEILIKEALDGVAERIALNALATEVTVSNVTFETDYPTPEEE